MPSHSSPLRRRALLVALCLAPCAAHAQGLPQRKAFWGFTAPWDSLSGVSVRRHGRALDAVVTGWIALDSTTALPLLPSIYPDTLPPRGRALRRMGLVTSWHGTHFHARSIRLLAADTAALARTAAAIATHAAKMRYRGLVLDFETLEKTDLDGQLRVVKAIADAAHARGVRPIVVAVPAEDTLAYPSAPLLRVADLIMPMLYDHHWSTSAAGAISEPSWARAALAARIPRGAASRSVAALPAYGYRWRLKGPAEVVGYARARALADSAHIARERDDSTGTLHAAVAGRWDLWVTDAQLLSRLVRDARRLGVRRFALWRLGQEDPAVWR
ncbi:MAG: hypothetical protein NVS9B3_11920 [Gemmatimonadaceae bacterium]